MVWHSFMLNPRSYVEDCIRHGKLSLWKTGLPWQAIDECINNDTFEYLPSSVARENFESRTSFAWDSLQDSSVTTVSCAKCKTALTCPWTTCDTASRWVGITPGEGGAGYADDDFKIRCRSCQFTTDHEILRGMKFRHDVEQLKYHDICMPGTILDKDGKTGHRQGESRAN